MKNIFKENDVLYRKKNDAFVLKDTFDYSGIAEKINSLYLESEDVHVFDSGKSSRFVQKEKIFKDSFNHFSIYDKNTHSLLVKIKKMLKDACANHEINYDRMFYFISSYHQKNVSTEHWYDTGGIRIPCFSGIAFLDETDPLEVTIGDKRMSLSSGDVILFESGHKIIYEKSDVNMLSFNIAPLDMLKGQYPQKWIPML